eukprot:766611-Hanusia_phi.AAC.3
MVLSWLTPTDNYGSFICSIKRSRHSLSMILASRKFVLGIPVQGMEEVLKQIGGQSGRDTDKVARLGLSTISLSSLRKKDNDGGQGRSRKIGGRQQEEEEEREMFVLGGCAAYLVCTVVSMVSPVEEGEKLSSRRHGDNFDLVVICRRRRRGNRQVPRGHLTAYDPFLQNQKSLCQRKVSRCALPLIVFPLGHEVCSYWDGKTFCACSSSTKPFMSFLGSGELPRSSARRADADLSVWLHRERPATLSAGTRSQYHPGPAAARRPTGRGTRPGVLVPLVYQLSWIHWSCDCMREAGSGAMRARD